MDAFSRAEVVRIHGIVEDNHSLLTEAWDECGFGPESLSLHCSRLTLQRLEALDNLQYNVLCTSK